MKAFHAAALVTVAAVFYTLLALAAKPLTLTACVGQTLTKRSAKCGKVGISPVSVLLRIRVEPHDENRGIAIRTSDDSYATEIPLEGSNADPEYQRVWFIQSEGDVEVAAYLVSTRGIIALDRQRLTIR